MPSSAKCVPASHSVHCLLPRRFANFPATHTSQEASPKGFLPLGDAVPISHFSESEEGPGVGWLVIGATDGALVTAGGVGAGGVGVGAEQHPNIWQFASGLTVKHELQVMPVGHVP